MDGANPYGSGGSNSEDVEMRLPPRSSLTSGIRAVPAKMPDGLSETVPLVVIEGRSVGKYFCPRPQRRRLTSVTVIRLNVATCLPSMVALRRNVCSPLSLVLSAQRDR